MRIRLAQFQGFIADEETFIRWYVHTFAPEHLPAFHQSFSEKDLSDMVRRGRNLAIKHGFLDPPSQVHFVTLMFKLGPTFFRFPGFQPITEATSLPGPERIRRYYEDVTSDQATFAILSSEDRLWSPDLLGDDIL